VDLDRAADSLIEAGRRLGARGLIAAAEGNLSLRLDAERLLVTPSGRRKDELDRADLVVVRFGHDPADARSPSGLRPTSDLSGHMAIHAARPELGAVAHAHLPAVLALTLAGEVPDPRALPETALFLPRLPFLRYGRMGSQELADREAAALSAPPEPYADAILLERHGAVAVAPDPATAVNRLELVEVLCRAWRDALLLRFARGHSGILVDPEAADESPASS
jgi:L-fuculose-phosphate aldolase